MRDQEPDAHPWLFEFEVPIDVLGASRIAACSKNLRARSQARTASPPSTQCSLNFQTFINSGGRIRLW